MRNEKVKILVEGSLIAGLCFIAQLTFGKLFIWPPTLISTPLSYFDLVPLIIAVYAYRRGIIPSLYMSAVLLIISLMVEGQIWFAPVDNNLIVAIDFVLEYIVAYAVFALPAIYSKKVKDGSFKHFVYGLILFGVAKWFIHGTAGFFWQSAYAQGEDYNVFFIFTYVIFNSAYLINTALCILVAYMSRNRLMEMVNR